MKNNNYDEILSYCGYDGLESFEEICKNNDMSKARDFIDNFMELCLIRACYEANIDAIKLMIEKGAKDFESGLITACCLGHKDIAELMIRHGAKGLDSALSYVSNSDSIEVAKVLIEHGATRLDWALDEACIVGGLKIVKLMFSLGVEKIEHYNVWSYLGEAIDARNYKIVNFMIEKIGKFHFCDLRKIDERNMLHVICFVKNIETSLFFTSTNSKTISITEAFEKFKTAVEKNISLFELVVDFEKTDQISKFATRFDKVNPNKKIIKLIDDYEKNQIWRPLKKRHNKFPNTIKKKILFILLLIKKFSLDTLKQKIPKPLIWMIINNFIINK